MCWIMNIKKKVIVFLKKVAYVMFIVLKKICKIISKVLIFLSSLVLMITPFLDNYIELTLAQRIWYPLFAFWLIYIIKKRNIKEEKPICETFRKWLIPGGLFVILSVFIFRFYNIDYIWKWVVFLFIFVYSPLVLFSLFKGEFIKNQQNEEIKDKLSKNFFTYILQLWFYDMVYLGVFNNWFWVTIIFGTMAVALALYNLTKAFLNSENKLIFVQVLNLLFALVGTAYLIFIIPNCQFKDIILEIIAAVYGGVFGLVGVAWTIKKQEADRKEDERKRHIPYIKVVPNAEARCEACAHIYKVLDLHNLDERAQLEDRVYYQILIEDCVVKNISESSVVLKGIVLAKKYYKFVDSIILEKGELCKIRTTDNWAIILTKQEKYMDIIVSDIMGNNYNLECKLNYLPGIGVINTTIGEESYTCLDFNCVVANIKIPIYRNGEHTE